MFELPINCYNLKKLSIPENRNKRVFVLNGADQGSRTLTSVAHTALNRACLPVPAHPHTIILYNDLKNITM